MENKEKNSQSFFRRHIVLILALFYVLWPIDIIPDFLVTLAGPAVALDDLLVLLIAIAKKILEYYKEKSPEVEELEEENLKDSSINKPSDI